MDSSLLKRRLTGAVVLVALGVIFIPIILSGGRDEMPLFGSNIPDKPRAVEKVKNLELSHMDKPAEAIKDKPIRLPVESHLPLSEIEKKSKLTNIDDSVSEKDSPISVFKSGKGKTGRKAWAVQVGSFANRANALALQKKLRKHKYAAFVEFLKKGDKGVYRVRIGPEVQRKKADDIVTTLKEKLGMKGVVMSHP